MTRASSASVRRRRPSKLEPPLDDLLKRRDEATKIVFDAAARQKATIDAAVKAANAAFEEEVGTAPDDIVTLNQELAAFMRHNHSSLVRTLGRTIKRAFGTVTIVLLGRELDLPADVKALTWTLFHDSEGEAFLKPYVPELATPLLKAAYENGTLSPRLEKILQGHGVRYRKHLVFRVKSSSDTNFLTISRRPYYERKKKEDQEE